MRREIASASAQSERDAAEAEMQQKVAADALSRLTTLEDALVRHNIDASFLIDDVQASGSSKDGEDARGGPTRGGRRGGGPPGSRRRAGR